MRNKIEKLQKILIKYEKIEFVNRLIHKIDFLLIQTTLTFKAVCGVFSDLPFIQLASHFSAFSPEDVSLLKKTVIELIEAAGDAWVKEFENSTPKELALVCAELTQDDEFKQEILEGKLTLKKSDLLENFSDLPKALLSIGARYFDPDLLKIISVFDEKLFLIDHPQYNNLSGAKLQLSNFAMFCTHFVELPLEKFMASYHRRYDRIVVGLDCSIQYKLGDQFYYDLSPSTRSQKETWDFKKIELETNEPKLLSVNIIYGHVLIIHESDKNRFWMLNISIGSALDAKKDFMGKDIKTAYIDLEKKYNNPYLNKDIGVDDDAQLEIWVIDAEDRFNEELLKERLPTKKVTITNIAETFSIPADADFILEKKCPYSVCYDPKTNNLMVTQDGNQKIFTDVFKNHPIYKYPDVKEKGNSITQSLSQFGFHATSKPKQSTKDISDKIENEETKKNARMEL